jgi:hypothetical protein
VPQNKWFCLLLDGAAIKNLQVATGTTYSTNVVEHFFTNNNGCAYVGPNYRSPLPITLKPWQISNGNHVFEIIDGGRGGDILAGAHGSKLTLNFTNPEPVLEAIHCTQTAVILGCSVSWTNPVFQEGNIGDHVFAIQWSVDGKPAHSVRPLMTSPNHDPTTSTFIFPFSELGGKLSHRVSARATFENGSTQILNPVEKTMERSLVIIYPSSEASTIWNQGATPILNATVNSIGYGVPKSLQVRFQVNNQWTTWKTQLIKNLKTHNSVKVNANTLVQYRIKPTNSSNYLTFDRPVAVKPIISFTLPKTLASGSTNYTIKISATKSFVGSCTFTQTQNKKDVWNTDLGTETTTFIGQILNGTGSVNVGSTFLGTFTMEVSCTGENFSPFTTTKSGAYN